MSCENKESKEKGGQKSDDAIRLLNCAQSDLYTQHRVRTAGKRVGTD
jgi:hypothetical protein